MRVPKAQALNGAPAKLNGGVTVAVVIESSLAPEMARPRRRAAPLAVDPRMMTAVPLATALMDLTPDAVQS
jgi:hypothetical protein